VIWFPLLANLWVYKILAVNLFAGSLVILGSLALYKKHNSFFLFLVLLLIFQWKTTQKVSLTALSNDERRIQVMRLGEYPPKYLRIGYWLEGRKESIAWTRIANNFSEVVGPNVYFFANHPRERVGVREFEKFPYVFLPIFLWGLLEGRWNRYFAMSFMAPVVLLSLIGSRSSIGPFSLMPFIVVGVAEGFKKIPSGLIKKLFVVLVVLVFIQMISYAKN